MRTRRVSYCIDFDIAPDPDGYAFNEDVQLSDYDLDQLKITVDSEIERALGGLVLYVESIDLVIKNVQIIDREGFNNEL